MDPTAWIEFIKRAIQSPEALAFLLFGLASGAMVGFLVGRWAASHSAARQRMEDLLKQMKELLERKELEIEQLKSRPIGPANNVVQPPGTSTNTGTSSTSDPISAAWWGRVESYLAGRGIERQEVSKLRDALASKNKGIRNFDNRLRIAIWRGGSGLLPVAMLWRAEKNPRVLFPDGTEGHPEKKDLEEIDQFL
jgi:hypothetical protein